MRKIIGIVGSYRAGGVHDQAVMEVLAGAAEAGAETRRVFLPEVTINFCTNCRACMQEPGDAPGRCVFDDAMSELLEACLRADGLVLATPHNFGSATAIFKRFLERFSPLAYWPWGMTAPRGRKGIPPKSAVLVLASAAPTPIWGLGGFTAGSTLHKTARLLNARVIHTLKYGMVSMEQHPQLTGKQRAVARASGRRLVTE